MPPIWMGLWVQNSLKKGPFFRQIFLKHGWTFYKLAKIVKNGEFFPSKFIIIIKMGMTATVGNWKRVAF